MAIEPAGNGREVANLALMLNRLRLYWEQSRGDDKWLLGLMLVPLLLCFWWQFSGTLPFWLFGFAAGFASYRRFAKPGLGLLLALGTLAIVGTTLLQHDLLSASWTAPIMQLLWFTMALPAGMHFGTVSHQD